MLQDDPSQFASMMFHRLGPFRMPTGLPLRAAAAIVVLFLCAGSAAVAQTLEGEWTNTPSWCGREYWVNNDNIHIGSDGYRVLESSCEFTGGTRFSSEHWLMKGRCAGEGPDGPGPEITIELRSLGGKLQIDAGGQVLSYAHKCGGASPSGGRTYWDHNGSAVYLVAEGKRRRFYYAAPRPGMQMAGAKEDDLLFEGTADASGYVGAAFIFNPRCGSASYRVSGPILDGGRRVVMRGQAPRLSNDCRVVGHRPDVLTFILSPEH